jgi:hypothetical protein
MLEEGLNRPAQNRLSGEGAVLLWQAVSGADTLASGYDQGGASQGGHRPSLDGFLRDSSSIAYVAGAKSGLSSPLFHPRMTENCAILKCLKNEHYQGYLWN